MRRRPALLLAVLTAALLVPAAPALAHPSVPLDPTLPTDLTFASTDNVEYLGRFPEHTAGGALSADGKRFFLTDPRHAAGADRRRPASATAPPRDGPEPLPAALALIFLPCRATRVTSLHDRKIGVRTGRSRGRGGR